MKRSIHILITICILVIRSNSLNADGIESITLEPSEALLTTTIAQDIEFSTNKNSLLGDESQNKQEIKSEQRSIDFHGGLDGPASNEDRHEAFRKRAKPLKNIFLGLYKNYKSTYLGNKTLTEYKNALRTRKEEKDQPQTIDAAIDEKEQPESNTETVTELSQKVMHESETLRPVKVNESFKPSSNEEKHVQTHSAKKRRKKQRFRKNNHRRTKIGEEKDQRPSSVYSYDFGHGYNMSLDMNNDIVNLHLAGDSLRDLMSGRFLKGRGKKYEMITRVLPLFIIPFLIQSAVVPFLVTKLKLLLMKSILVGKLAIFLLVISAIKNGNKMMQTYEVAPSYWAGEPSRRSELAAAASAAAYNGYRVEGKPAAWIN